MMSRAYLTHCRAMQSHANGPPISPDARLMETSRRRQRCCRRRRCRTRRGYESPLRAVEEGGEVASRDSRRRCRGTRGRRCRARTTAAAVPLEVAYTRREYEDRAAETW